MSQRRVPLLPRPGIFLMRDGVICQREDEPTTLDQPIALVPGALEGLRLLACLDAPVIVLSRHDAAAAASLGHVTGRQLRSTLRTHGARVDGIRSYSMAPRDGVQCERKALVRLLHRAARQYMLDLASSVLIGDTWTDMHAAVEVGCQPVLVMTGRGRDQITLPHFASIRSRT